MESTLKAKMYCSMRQDAVFVPLVPLKAHFLSPVHPPSPFFVSFFYQRLSCINWNGKERKKYGRRKGNMKRKCKERTVELGNERKIN